MEIGPRTPRARPVSSPKLSRARPHRKGIGGRRARWRPHPGSHYSPTLPQNPWGRVVARDRVPREGKNAESLGPPVILSEAPRGSRPLARYSGAERRIWLGNGADCRAGARARDPASHGAGRPSTRFFGRRTGGGARGKCGGARLRQNDRLPLATGRSSEHTLLGPTVRIEIVQCAWHSGTAAVHASEALFAERVSARSGLVAVPAAALAAKGGRESNTPRGGPRMVRPDRFTL
jgi:hypothetical protein